MVARVAATSKCREKTKEPILAEEPEEIPPPYVPRYPPLPPASSSTRPPATLDGETQGTVTPVKSGLETSGASTPLNFLSPMDPIPTPSPPVLTPHPSLNQEHLASLHDTPTLQIPTALQMPLMEAQNPCIMTRKAKYKEEDRHLSTSPLPLETCSTGNIIPFLHRKVSDPD
jgi:hypothetical protein